MATAERSGGLQRAGLDAVAGAVAGAVSRTVVSPLDVIKIRFQVQVEPTGRRPQRLGGTYGVSKYTGIWQAARDIVREEGLVGLWRGNVPALLLVMPYTAIQFVVLQKSRAMAAEYNAGGELARPSAAVQFVTGSIAGAAATIGSYPFDLLRTVMASQGEPKVYSTMRSACKEIIQARGYSGLYAGLIPSLVEIVPYAGLQFGSYEALKKWTKNSNLAKGRSKDSKGETLSAVEQFFCGLGAGTLAKTCCHPLDVVKKRFQVEGLVRDVRYGARIEHKAYKGMVDAGRRILEKEGWRGLYKGALPSILKAAPASAITFVVYEQVVSFGLEFFGSGSL